MTEKWENYDTVVLSGGGLKGFHILGAIQALYDMCLLKNIKTYVGSSIGAVISYLLAIGYTPIEIVVSLYSNRWIERVQQFNLVAMINGNGASSYVQIGEALEKMTLDKIGRLLTLEKLQEDFGVRLVCTTYNMTTCQIEYLCPENNPDLPCLTALRMSSNIPLVFERYKYMDNYYIDGGIADNFPIAKGVELGEKVIGICIDLSQNALRDEPEDGMMTYFFRLLQIPIIQSTRYRSDSVKDKCTIIQIKTTELKNIIQFDINSKERLNMFSNGYSVVREFFESE